ncbi:MAG TPA: hypothetical protein VFS71_01935 [Flavobacterium sp.]|uniref:hypothetical protein n=1 Tax=Flavobacterium sp. TaxID=239 RepID=UPI002DB9C638|nr:hypothetical protein [Flavobacterium sp.]HEU4788419.1 hypothetical protein [Flavobacterium sp.]
MMTCQNQQQISAFIEGGLKRFVKSQDNLEQLQDFVILLNPRKEKLLNNCCWECPHCYDLRTYVKILFDFVNETMTLQEVEKKLQEWDKVKASDEIIDNIAIPERKLNLTACDAVTGKIYYPDFNFIDEIEKRDLFEELKNKDLYFIYSPIHLEEVYRMKLPYQEERIQTISKITSDNYILPMGNRLELHKLHPKYSYERVKDNPGISRALEKSKIVNSKDRDIFFTEIKNRLQREINNIQNVFDYISKTEFHKLLSFSGYRFTVADFKKTNKSYDEILHMIYTLCSIMDNLSFNRDNKGRTLRSSVYDIEHLIYATKADFFVTGDKKLSNRAIEIYSYLELDIEVLFIDTNNFILDKLT